MASFSGLEAALQEAEASVQKPSHRSALSSDITRTPTKARSLSDTTPALSPSPHFKEPSSKAQDDQLFIATPSRIPRHPTLYAARSNLSIQMPPRDPGFGLTDSPVRQSQTNNSEYEHRESYGSPSSVLPRHSRGLDFSRACTNLHHSTLAESTPSSPTIAQRSMMAPSSRRASTAAMNIDPRGGGGFDRLNGFQSMDRGAFFPRSYGSATALTSDASSSSSDDDELMRGTEDPDEDMVTTPQLRRHEPGGAVTPFASHSRANITPRGLRGSSPMNFHFNANRGRHTRGWPRHGSLSARQQSAILSPEDLGQSGENSSGSYDEEMRSPISRRESISFGTNSLHISSSHDSNDGENPSPSSMAAPPTPGVVRRAVTRRSNLLPKTKGFARIRAALQEEHAPVDSEAIREAEIVRQVRVKDVGEHSSAMPTSPIFSPSIPHTPSLPTDQSDAMSDVDALGILTTDSTSTIESTRATDLRRASTSKEFWPHLYQSTIAGASTTPPPPPLFHRHRSSSGMSLSEDTDATSPHLGHRRSTRSQSSISTSMLDTPHPPPPLTAEMSEAGSDMTVSTSAPPSATPSRETAGAGFHPPVGITQADISRKVTKRRRDDDFDIASFKRRAVSPGMASVHSSPVTGQSPVSNSGGWPAAAAAAAAAVAGQGGKAQRESVGGTSAGVEGVGAGAATAGEKNGAGERPLERAPSVASGMSDGGSGGGGGGQRGSMTPSFGPKRVGFQGMTDTNDGLMKMSIE